MSVAADRLPFQKPRKRIVDRVALTRYLRAHPFCECGCKRRSTHFHHLRSRKMGGDDVPDNGLALFWRCHDEWHRIGGRRWLRAHAKLSDEARTKVEKALRL